MPALTRGILPGGRGRAGARASAYAARGAATPFDGHYDIRAVPFAADFVFPTEPDSSAEPTVCSDLAALNVALETPGSLVHVDAVISGTAVIAADDITLILLPGATLETLRINRSVHRIRVENLVVDTGVVFQIPGAFDDDLGETVYSAALLATDVIFKDCEIVGSGANPNGAIVYGRRIAFVDCTIEGSDYGVFVGSPNGSIQNQDILIANCDVTGDQEATVRMLFALRSIVLDCTLSAAIKHTWRQHLGGDYSYCGRCVCVGSGAMLTDPTEGDDVLNLVWYVGNDVTYTNGNGVMVTLEPYVRMAGIVMTGNTFRLPEFFGDGTFYGEVWPYGEAPTPDYVFTGNTVVLL